MSQSHNIKETPQGIPDLILYCVSFKNVRTGKINETLLILWSRGRIFEAYDVIFRAQLDPEKKVDTSRGSSNACRQFEIAAPKRIMP